MAEMVEIDVVIYRDGDHWIAQGLQHDIVAQVGLADFDQLPARFVRTVAAELATALDLNEQPLAAIHEAPSRFWQMHKASRMCLSIDIEALRIDGRQSSTPRISPRMRIVEQQHAA